MQISPAVRPSRRACARRGATSAGLRKASACPARRSTDAWNASICGRPAAADGHLAGMIRMNPRFRPTLSLRAKLTALLFGLVALATALGAWASHALDDVV